jgi:hypothetical protein
MSDLEAIPEKGGAAAAVEFAPSQIAVLGSHPGICANCHAQLLGPYCAACGQPRDVHRRSVGHLLRDLVQDIASFDSRIMRTARALLLRPGELALAYHEGRTQPFVPPVRLYLFVSLLFFLVLSLTDIAIMQFRLEATPVAVQMDAQHHPYRIVDDEKQALPQRYVDGKPHYDFDPHVTFFTRLGSEHSGLTPDARAAVEATLHPADVHATPQNEALVTRLGNVFEKLANDPGALNGAITTWIPRVLFALLPLFAVLLAVFYWRQRQFFFVDHLVFSLSFHSFVFLLLLLAALAAQTLPGGAVAWAVFLAVPAYLLLALRRLYRQSWGWTAVKFSAIAIIYTLFFLLPAFAAIVSLSFFGVQGPHLG